MEVLPVYASPHLVHKTFRNTGKKKRIIIQFKINTLMRFSTDSVCKI